MHHQFECRCFIVSDDFKVIQVKIDSWDSFKSKLHYVLRTNNRRHMVNWKQAKYKLHFVAFTEQFLFPSDLVNEHETFVDPSTVWVKKIIYMISGKLYNV